jgi:arginine decarboxylase
MNIIISSSLGSGQTELSAFDDALYKAGVANFNLVRLSSVIPPQSVIKTEPYANNGKECFGDRLYLVYAEQRESIPGKEAWAGIGWVQAEDGRGLFVEHEGPSEEFVRTQIQDSLTDMVKYRVDTFGEINFHVVGMRCEDKPVCAFVAAVYKSEIW